MRKSGSDNRKLPSAEERRASWLRFWRAVLRGSGLLAGTGAAAALAIFGGRASWRYATTAPAFAIEQVAVGGDVDVATGAHLSADQVRAVSGISLGTNLFQASLTQAKGRLEQNPWIRSATLRRELPRRLHVDVVQRRAVAYLELSGLYLVDERGEVFKRATAQDGPGGALDLPTITGLARKDFIAGSPALREQLSWALALIEPPAGASLPWEAGELSEVHFDEDLGLTLELGSLPTRVELGFPPFEEKLERLRRARKELSRRQLQATALYLEDSRQPDHVGMALAGMDPVANKVAP